MAEIPITSYAPSSTLTITRSGSQNMTGRFRQTASRYRHMVSFLGAQSWRILSLKPCHVPQPPRPSQNQPPTHSQRCAVHCNFARCVAKWVVYQTPGGEGEKEKIGGGSKNKEGETHSRAQRERVFLCPKSGKERSAEEGGSFFPRALLGFCPTPAKGKRGGKENLFACIEPPSFPFLSPFEKATPLPLLPPSYPYLPLRQRGKGGGGGPFLIRSLLKNALPAFLLLIPHPSLPFFSFEHFLALWGH